MPDRRVRVAASYEYGARLLIRLALMIAPLDVSDIHHTYLLLLRAGFAKALPEKS